MTQDAAFVARCQVAVVAPLLQDLATPRGALQTSQHRSCPLPPGLHWRISTAPATGVSLQQEENTVGERPFKVLGIQQIAVGASDKSALNEASPIGGEGVLIELAWKRPKTCVKRLSHSKKE